MSPPNSKTAKIWRGRGASTLQDQARIARKTNPSTANQLDLQAEEQFSIARMYRRTRDFNYVGGMSSSDSIENGIEKNVARELSEAGYGAVWAAPAKGELPDIWGDLKVDITKNRKKTVWLSGLVAVFVSGAGFPRLLPSFRAMDPRCISGWNELLASLPWELQLCVL